MNSDAILWLIDQIAAVGSTKEKAAMLKAFGTDDMFRRVLRYTYDPFKTYGIIPQRPSDVMGCQTFSRLTWDLLDGLARRDYSGDRARQAVDLAFMTASPASADLLWRIISKDLRAGFSETTINAAIPGLIPDFPYMRCCLPKHTDLDKFDWVAGVYSQMKADGLFANIDHEVGNNVVRITSRQGSQFPIAAFPLLEHEVRSRLRPGTQSHGELLVVRDGAILPREIGNGVLNSVLKGGSFTGNDYPVYQVWDQIPLTAVKTKGRYEVPYAFRIIELEGQLSNTKGISIGLVPTRVVHSRDEAMTHYREMLSQGFEGTIVKNPTAIWIDGTSKDQVKLKTEFDVDLVVTGVVPGRAGTKNEGRAGSLSCATSCGKLRTDVTVKNEKMRADVDRDPSAWIGRIIAVRSNMPLSPSESNDLHSLFLPRMVDDHYRPDKTTADDLQRVLDQYEAAIRG